MTNAGSSTIRLLGRPALFTTSEKGSLAPKAAQLIAYLALSPTRSESRESLAHLLWGTRPQARANLCQLLRRMRRAARIRPHRQRPNVRLAL